MFFQAVIVLRDLRMSNKIVNFYKQLQQLEAEQGIGIVSVIVQEKQSPYESYAFELNGVIDISFIVHPNYMDADCRILKELTTLANKYNLQLKQVIISNKK